MILKNKQRFRNRIYYGFGMVGSTVFDTFIGSFLTLYATDVLGLDALYFASLLIFPKVVDILIDFFIMYFVGKTRSRFGMYRPWLLNMVGIVIAFITLFSVPMFKLSDHASLSIILIVYFLSDSIFTSFYWIPYAAIPGVMTDDENEIVNITSSRTIFDYIFATMVSAITMPILMAFGGHRNPKGWSVAALIFGIISLISSIICFVFIKTEPELEKKMTKEYSFADMFKDYKFILFDKGFILITVLLAFSYLAIYTHQVVSYYFYIYNLNAEEVIGYFAIVGATVTIVTSLFAGKLQEKHGFKKSLIVGLVLFIVSAVIMMFSYNIPVMIISGCFSVSGTTIIVILLDSLRPVVAKNLDSEKVKTPLNSTIGLTSIIEGASVILGNTLGAAVISISKYDPELMSQKSVTLNMFRYCTPAFSILLSMIMIIFLMRTNKDSIFGGNN